MNDNPKLIQSERRWARGLLATLWFVVVMFTSRITGWEIAITSWTASAFLWILLFIATKEATKQNMTNESQR